MKLTRYTDYAVRVLVFLGSCEEGLSSIAEVARTYNISQNHLMKVVQDLGHLGYVETVRGRNGGIRLGRPANQINLGALVRHTEGEFDLIDCSTCTIAGACGLPNILVQATRAFFEVLDKYTIADILAERSKLRGLFGLPIKVAQGA